MQKIKELKQKFVIKEKGKFVVIIGDDGAVLSYFSGKKLVSRLFALSSRPADTKEFTELFVKHPNSPIYLIIDNVEQSYVKQILPAISSFTIGKLVKKRLERDFLSTDVKGAYLMGRADQGRKDWLYMFISISMTESLSQWLSYFSELPNLVKGIYTLPVEMGAVLRKINDQILNQNDNKAKDWQILVSHNKTSGFRQIVMYKGSVIFTRLIRSGKDTMPDIIAGNIEQEILNTVDYLRRLSFGDSDPIDVIAIVSADIKKSLVSAKIRSNNIMVFTPSEICAKFNFANVSNDTDKFADLFLSAHFSYNKSLLRMLTPEINRDNSIVSLKNILAGCVYGIASLMMPYFIGVAFMFLSINSDISDLNKNKVISENKWKDTQLSYRYNLNDSDKIMDAVMVANKLKANSDNPLKYIDKLYLVQNGYAYTSSVNINYRQSSTNSPKSNSSDSNYILNMTTNFKFYNTGNSPEDLFKNFDDFIGRINKNFVGYDIEHSKLPEKISSGILNNKLDILLTVKTKQ